MPPKKKAAPPPTPPVPSDDLAEAHAAYDALAEKYETLEEHMNRRPSVSINLGQLRVTYYLPLNHPLLPRIEARIDELAAQADTPPPAPPEAPPMESFEQWATQPPTFEQQLAEDFSKSDQPREEEMNAVFGAPDLPAPSVPSPAPVAPVASTKDMAIEEHPLPCWKCGSTQLQTANGKFGVFYKCPNCQSDDNPNFSLIVTAKDYWLKKQYAGKKCPKCGGDLTYMKGQEGKAPFLGCANYKTRGCKFTLTLPLLSGPRA